MASVHGDPVPWKCGIAGCPKGVRRQGSTGSPLGEALERALIPMSRAGLRQGLQEESRTDQAHANALGRALFRVYGA